MRSLLLFIVAVLADLGCAPVPSSMPQPMPRAHCNAPRSAPSAAPGTPVPFDMGAAAVDLEARAARLAEAIRAMPGG